MLKPMLKNAALKAINIISVIFLGLVFLDILYWLLVR